MRELYRRLRFTLVMLVFSSGVFAQERVVTGTVLDETGSPMPGINVLVKGTAKGTATDQDGKYSLAVPDDAATLVFSFVGYASVEQVVGSRTGIDVQMTADITTLQELVVTGYAVQEKKDITGAVGTVKPADLIAIPAANPESQLQGRIAGVNVISNGVPGAGSAVRVRGYSSFGGVNTNNQAINQSNPLYIVDGTPTYDISTINSIDIESMSVLKDAGAASIYGARASNGVIVVTTKKGTKDGKPRISYDMYYGLQDPGDGIDNLLNPQEQADLEWLAKTNDGSPLQSDMYGDGATPFV